MFSHCLVPMLDRSSTQSTLLTNTKRKTAYYFIAKPSIIFFYGIPNPLTVPEVMTNVNTPRQLLELTGAMLTFVQLIVLGQRCVSGERRVRGCHWRWHNSPIMAGIYCNGNIWMHEIVKIACLLTKAMHHRVECPMAFCLYGDHACRCCKSTES